LIADTATNHVIKYQVNKLHPTPRTLRRHRVVSPDLQHM
jgi:hypothetical protein